MGFRVRRRTGFMSLACKGVLRPSFISVFISRSLGSSLFPGFDSSFSSLEFFFLPRSTREPALPGSESADASSFPESSSSSLSSSLSSCRGCLNRSMRKCFSKTLILCLSSLWIDVCLLTWWISKLLASSKIEKSYKSNMSKHG